MAAKTQPPRSGRAPGRPAVGARAATSARTRSQEVDYKNVNQLRRYISEKGKIRNRRITGACRRHQRQVAVAVKRAREMALLPYVAGVRDGGHPDAATSRSSASRARSST